MSAVVVVAAISTSALVGQQASPPADTPEGRILVGERRLVSADAPTSPHIEPALAVNPANPQQMLASSIVYDNGVVTSVVYATDDGGERWIRSAVGPGVPELRGGDPVVDFDTQGAALFGAIDGHPEGFLLWRSANAGLQWNSVARLPGGLYDRPFIAVDRSNNPRTRGRIYAAGVVVVGRGPEFARSLIATTSSADGGQTFAPPVFFDPTVLGQGLGGVADVIVTRQGNVLVPFVIGGRIWTIQSTDGGRSYSAARPGPRVGMGTGYRVYKTNGSRRAVMDTSSRSPFIDRLYLSWIDFADGRYDVTVAHSDDEGATWSFPVRVNDNTSVSDPANPGIAVNGDGVVLVTFNDRRDDPQNDCFRLYAAASLDGGETFLPNIPVGYGSTCPAGRGNWPGLLSSRLLRDRDTQQWFHVVRMSGAPERFPNGGETQGLAAGPDGRFHAAWINDASGVMQIYYTDLRIERPQQTRATRLRDYTGTLEVVVRTPVTDFDQRTLRFSVAVRNTSQEAIRGPLTLRLARLEGALGELRAANSDNGRAGIGATWDVPLNQAQMLAPGQESPWRELRFSFNGEVPPEPATTGRFVAQFKVLEKQRN